MGGRDNTKELEVIEKEHVKGSDVQSVETSAVGADLAAAVIADPPSLWSKGMLKLWGLVSLLPPPASLNLETTPFLECIAKSRN